MNARVNLIRHNLYFKNSIFFHTDTLKNNLSEILKCPRKFFVMHELRNNRCHYSMLRFEGDFVLFIQYNDIIGTYYPGPALCLKYSLKKIR